MKPTVRGEGRMMEGGCVDSASACNALDMIGRTVSPPGMCAVDSCFRLTFYRILSIFVDFEVNMEQFKLGQYVCSGYPRTTQRPGATWLLRAITESHTNGFNPNAHGKKEMAWVCIIKSLSIVRVAGITVTQSGG